MTLEGAPGGTAAAIRDFGVLITAVRNGPAPELPKGNRGAG
jgi:hypothetical protein